MLHLGCSDTHVRLLKLHPSTLFDCPPPTFFPSTRPQFSASCCTHNFSLMSFSPFQPSFASCLSTASFCRLLPFLSPCFVLSPIKPSALLPSSQLLVFWPAISSSFGMFATAHRPILLAGAVLGLACLLCNLCNYLNKCPN